MSIYFDGAGEAAERICAEQFNGTLTDEKKHQYKDIDLFIKGKSCSVKDQLHSSKKWGSVQVELQLINTDDDSSMQGCFYSNESDYYFWRIHTEEKGDSWCVIESAKLKALVEQKQHSFRKWYTTKATEARNKKYGRTFNRSVGVVIPVSELVKIGKVIKVCIKA